MPVYNEADTIENTITELSNVVAKTRNVDIWVFEDGSVDGTKEILRRLVNTVRHLYVESTEEKKGYPRAMKEAFLSIDPNTYEYVMSMDSDGQYDPTDFFKIWDTMQQHSPDIVMGRRITRAEPFYRKFLSSGLRFIEGLMFPLSCKDVTSVLRLMHVTTAQDIAKEVKYSQYNFWLEFTARMALKGYNVIEIPVNYRERAGGSKVYSVKKMPKVILSEFKALRQVKEEWNGGSLKSIDLSIAKRL
jgi:glycosyltransferase involved in cell wall biosynthesis